MIDFKTSKKYLELTIQSLNACEDIAPSQKMRLCDLLDKAWAEFSLIGKA